MELKKAKQLGAHESVILDNRLFGGRGSHEYKQEIARKLVLSEALEIFPGYSDESYFDSSYFDTEGIKVSPTLRLECVFVDWKDGKWVHGFRSDEKLSERIRKFTRIIRDAVSDLDLA